MMMIVMFSRKLIDPRVGHQRLDTLTDGQDTQSYNQSVVMHTHPTPAHLYAMNNNTAITLLFAALSDVFFPFDY